jgi:CRP/FNR family transcriptional regulator, cyclic AMP receptor protein
MQGAANLSNRAHNEHGPSETTPVFGVQVSGIDQRFADPVHKVYLTIHVQAFTESLMAEKRVAAYRPAELFGRVSDEMTNRVYSDKEVIFAQGAKADAMFYVQAGNVKLTVKSNKGKKAVIAVLRQGDFFGEGCMAQQSKRLSSATAIRQSTIARIKKSTIVAVIHDDPAFAKIFIAYLLTRIERVEEDFVDQIFSSSEKRLARILLALASFGVQSKPNPAILKVSQETLAEMVGTTRSRVSHFMNRFRKMGLIDYNGSLQVHRSLLTYLLND